MTFKDLLVVQSMEYDNGPALTVAAWLAAKFGAHLHGLCLVTPTNPTMAECFALGADAEASVTQRLRHEEDAAVEPIEAAFRRELSLRGVSGDWVRIDNCLAEADAPFHARLVNLTIMARPDDATPRSLALADAFLMEAATPCLFVPTPLRSPVALERVIVAWNGSREASRTVADALPLLEQAGAVRILTVGHPAEVTMCTGAGLSTHLTRYGISAEVRHCAAGHVAERVLDACENFGANFLIMGAYGHAHLIEETFGGTTRHILENTALPVFMSR
ncbi:MAG: universal stress protein [Candidatus Sphingomonas colombiensis]|nr:universal stress protein [Sphingomonas sp.]WEK43217.1 MAG: universal stress protein [Sphingomonas sp.]